MAVSGINFSDWTGFTEQQQTSAQLQADWTETDAKQADYILNKPTNLSQFNNDLTGVVGDFHVPGNFTVGGSAGATTGTTTATSSSVIPNWTETDAVAADYISNKPTNLSQFTNDLTTCTGNWTVPGNLFVLGNANVTPGTSTSQQVNADWNSTGGASLILNKPPLSAVATLGTYASLTGNIPKQLPWTPVNFANGSANASYTSQPAQYCIDEIGYVRIRGCVTTPSSLATSMFVLPQACWPAFQLQFVCACGGSSVAIIVINTNGSVSQISGSPGSIVYLNPIMFALN